ncbi:calcium/sodium antiporter [Candidatus Uhrbacteria bacterium]|nr:calcium/sodium antiporter [Candidatus Uhrbacteria bacterium]
MIFSIVLLGAGIALLIYGARFLVDGGSSLARRFGISPLVVGLTIVAFGTSAPELIVNIFASISGSADIAMGNVLGSNLANILLILGIAAAIYPLRVQSSTVWKEIPMSLLAVVAVGVMVNDAFVDGLGFNILSRSEGVILLFFFLIFMYYTYGISKSEGDGPPVRVFKTGSSALMILGGLLGLFVGGRFTVDAAVAIARALQVSEALIGFTVVAIGTSLPELFTSAIAAARRQVDIAIGNVVGSNIFNIFFVLGISSIIRPIPFSPILNTDLMFVIVATLLLFAFLFVGKRHILERWQGVGFIGLYLGYLAFAVARG